jgi:Mrp family chromosome partitioning ATPase
MSDPLVRSFDGVASRIDALGLRSVGFTSSLAGEGVTTLALGSAMALAAIRGDGVLLIDANWVVPSLTTDANLVSGPGLADHLAGRADLGSVIHETGRPRLGFVPVGDRALARPTLRALAALLTHDIPDYSTVVVDLPPLLASESYVLPWATVLDQVFVVIREAATPLSAARTALERLGVSAPQVILNRPAPSRLKMPSPVLAQSGEGA